MRKQFVFATGAVALALAVFALTGKGLAASPEPWAAPLTEPDWIRDGLPIEYDHSLWYPTREVENLLDAEVYLLGESRGVKFFCDRTDIKPFERIYTRFGKNRYRAFEKKP